ncbi:hypothetical protein Arth_1975 [Arthrobacter sp. FB24]|nr:hypothetical protein Arth_1975 [Arthrobacter sp. FB24]
MDKPGPSTIGRPPPQESPCHCRLLGLHAGSRPVRATFRLLDAPDSLSDQSRPEPDGAGIGSS